MGNKKAYLIGFAGGLGTIAAFVLPTLAVTGWAQSPASAIALAAGIATAVARGAGFSREAEAASPEDTGSDGDEA